MCKTSLTAALVAAGTLVFPRAQAATSSYPAMAPLRQYLSATAADEIALARSAAPASISAQAEVLVLDAHGYKVGVKGSNGFVCFVMRSWGQDFDQPEFWNPKVRSPQCINAAAARSMLPDYLTRTRWVLAGGSVADMLARTKAAVAAKKITPPSPVPSPTCCRRDNTWPTRRTAGIPMSCSSCPPSTRQRWELSGPARRCTAPRATSSQSPQCSWYHPLGPMAHRGRLTIEGVYRNGSSRSGHARFRVGQVDAPGVMVAFTPTDQRERLSQNMEDSVEWLHSTQGGHPARAPRFGWSLGSHRVEGSRTLASCHSDRVRGRTFVTA